MAEVENFLLFVMMLKLSVALSQPSTITCSFSCALTPGFIGSVLLVAVQRFPVMFTAIKKVTEATAKGSLGNLAVNFEPMYNV